MWKYRIGALVALILAALVGYFVYSTEIKDSKYAFKLGLDLNSGSHLVYKAETENIEDVGDAMETLREVIERRVNLFGVSEPIVQVEKSGVLGGGENRLIVELPGVTDIQEAIRLIGVTPLLEFKLLRKEMEGLSEKEFGEKTMAEAFEPTELTGRYLKRADVGFEQTLGEAQVLLQFNPEGEKIFAKITKENVGRILAIFLDGVPISAPVIREEIKSGTAQISGGFTPEQAKELVRNLNYGALPVPISLVSTQTIGASLGEQATKAGIRAGWISFLVIGIFLILWYRLPGLVSVVALAVYVALNLAIFKLLPVTLTAAGIAGFILSMGMAVDANILIFERMKEELRRGRVLDDAIKEGFGRAWLSIRDSNISSILTAIILFYFATTPVIKGFALVFAIGVLTSMFTAITVSRTILRAVQFKDGKVAKFLFGSGMIR